MKLPDDPKQKKQILALIGIGVVVVLYVGIMYGIKPLSASKVKAAQNIEDFTNKTKKAVVEIKSTGKDKADTADSLKKAKDLADANVLLPTLANNYLIPAQEIIESCAKAAKVDVKVKELGALDFKPKGLFRAYRVGVTLQCGYNGLIAFLGELEKINVCLCVPSISISGASAASGQPGAPKSVDKHAINLEVHWPVWATPTGQTTFDKRVQNAISTVKKPSANEKAK